MPEIQELTQALNEFTQARDWSMFHSPKNLALALAGEVGEVCQILRWKLSDELSQSEIEDLRGELADVGIFLLLLADAVTVDLASAVREKIDLNRTRFPESNR
jgi:NTP pyrophosphatase (non-canonical NTP hydrolase)